MAGKEEEETVATRQDLTTPADQGSTVQGAAVLALPVKLAASATEVLPFTLPIFKALWSACSRFQVSTRYSCDLHLKEDS